MARTIHLTASLGAVLFLLLTSTASIAQSGRARTVATLDGRSSNSNVQHPSVRGRTASGQAPSHKNTLVSTGKSSAARARNGGQASPRLANVRRAPKHAVSAVQTASIQLSNDYDALLVPGVSGTFDEYDGVGHTEISGTAHALRGEFGCDSCGMATQCCCNPIGALFDWSRVDVWLGMNSFTGAANFITGGTDARGQIEGNFGFQEGFNFGSRVPSLLSGQIGSQIGMRFTQTQLDGNVASEDSRNQLFLTAGLFRRVDYGLQGGLVIDYLHDDWIYRADLVQLRGELSYLFSPCHDFGFRFTDSQQVDELDVTIRGVADPVPIELAALNNYRFFYRYRFGERGRGLAELQVGFTEDSGAVLGVSLKTPLQGQLGLETSATYLLPAKDAAQPYQTEGWNMGLACVWTPGRLFGTGRDYYRPLLDVADNGNFLTRLRR